MKILYVSHDRRAAELAARALSGFAPELALTWARSLGSALHWVEANGDAAAVILEAVLDPQACVSFVEQVRRRSSATLVVVVLGHGQPEQALAGLNARADGYVVVGDSLVADLRSLLADLIQRERLREQTVAERVTEIEAVRTEAAHRVERAEQDRAETERRRAAEVAAASARLADIEARHSASLAREARICTALQQQLLELEAALRHAEERRASDAVAAADQLAKRHAEFTESLAQASQWRDALAAKLAQATAAFEEAQEGRRADVAAAAERLERREAEMGAALAEAVAARMALERALADANAAHRATQQRAVADLAAASERQAALEDLLAQECDRRTAVDQRLAAAESAQQEAERRYAAELTAAGMRLADLQSRYDAAQTHGAAARAALEHQLEQATAAHARLEQRAADDRHAASRREGDLLQRLTNELQAREALQCDLTATRAEGARSRRRLLDVAAAHRRRSREQNERLQAQLAGARADAERQLRAKSDEIREIALERARLQDLLARTEEELRSTRTTLGVEREASERAQSISQSELQRALVECDQLRQSLAHLQTSFDMLERVAGEHARERAKLESVVAERDDQLSAQAARHSAAEQAAADALAQLQGRLRDAVDTSTAEIARLRGAVEALHHEVEATQRDAAALRAQAERVPVLQRELKAAQNDQRRQFERAPHALCRCTAEGVITEANHSLAALLGRRRPEELRNMNFAATVSDHAGDLGWVIERARTTRKTERVEANWKTRDGRRLLVRVHAVMTSDGGVEIVVEDITHVRTLEGRLRQGERLEAAGRLAAEVAVTCDALLRDVTRDGYEWLAALERDNPLRDRGELLLTEVARAASFLRQLGVYSNKQLTTIEPVSVQRVLRDLAPVLKQVLGEDIELVFPKTFQSFDVDVDAERIERVLVTLVSYARDRMPGGGQVTIDLASTLVGQRFVSRHPHVRPGPHVVMTVSEVRRAGAVTEGPSSSERPGMDLRALVEIIGQCGGHLWMEAQPDGNMTVKIHLPRRVPFEAVGVRGSEERAQRSSRFARWFRSTPAAVNS